MIEDGPTPVMRYEHSQIRQLLDAIHQRVEGLNPETDQDEQVLINLLSSHNRKEERALYPAIDNVTNADERATILSNMNSIRKTGTMPAVVNTDGIRREGRGDMRGILSHFTLSLLALFGLLFAGWLGIETVSGANSARAESGQSPPDGKLKGNVLRGRDIFNGKGVCYYCHGIDGYIGRPPRLSADTAALIAKLNPPPSDLRNPDELRLKADKERALAIREGHPGTGMFPDHTMTDQDLADLLLYLALIRKDPHPEQ